MELYATRAAFLVFLACGTLAPQDAHSQMNTSLPDAADATAFHTYLAEHGLAARWAGEASPLTSPEIRAAYPGLRFYYTFRSPPAPPGAYLPDVIAAHRRAMEEYRKYSLRLTVGIDGRGQAHGFGTPEDFNTGLKPVTTDEEARIAAAAILSLTGIDQLSPGVIPIQDISVTKSGDEWICQVSHKPKGIQGTVTFDHSGRCTAVSKRLNYSPPIPS